MDLNPVIEMIPVESSQLKAYGYNPDQEVLAIRFNGKDGREGSLYHYRNFGASEWAAFQDAPSKGSHFIRNVKPFPDRYPYARIDETPAADLESAQTEAAPE